MGFATFLRAGTAWDSFEAPADGGLPAGGVVVSGRGEGERVAPGLRIVEWEEEPADVPDHAGVRWTFAHSRGVLEIRAPD